MNMNEPKLRFKADDGSQFPDWEEHKIKEFVTESNILGHTGKEAKKLTVKLWAKGVVPKENVFSGSENTQYYIRHSGQLMYGKLDFLNCAFGIVPPELDGYESTLDAPAFDMHDISDKFLLSYVTRKIFYKKNGDIANGSRKAKRIHPDVFGEMSIMVPSLPEQQKIAEFLSTIDTVIAKQKETVSAWEERKKGVMQKLFSQEVRFKADNGSEFPEWENVTVLDLLVQPITDGPHETPVLEENGVSFVSVEAIDNGRVNLTKRRGFISKEYDNACAKKYKPQLYDVYMVKSGATTGKVAIVTITDDFNIWSPLAAMRTSSKTEAFFLYYQLQSDMIQNQVWTKLSLGNQPNLGMRALELFSAVRPCIAEQQKIADCLSSLDEVIEKQKATLAAWEELKKGLLQQMFV